MSVFIIGSNDYSANVIAGTYEVNKNDVYKEYTDANDLTHRFVTREKISGSFDMYFMKYSDYQAFVTDLTDQKTTNSTYPCTVAVNNRLTTETINCYIECSPVRNRAGSGKTYMDTFTVTIEER